MLISSLSFYIYSRITQNLEHITCLQVTSKSCNFCLNFEIWVLKKTYSQFLFAHAIFFGSGNIVKQIKNFDKLVCIAANLNDGCHPFHFHVKLDALLCIHSGYIIITVLFDFVNYKSAP